MENIKLEEIKVDTNNSKMTTLIFSENKNKKEIVFKGEGSIKLVVKA